MVLDAMQKRGLKRYQLAALAARYSGSCTPATISNLLGKEGEDPPRRIVYSAEKRPIEQALDLVDVEHKRLDVVIDHWYELPADQQDGVSWIVSNWISLDQWQRSVIGDFLTSMLKAKR